MRQIKFRAWDKKAKVMRSVINLFANGHVYVDCHCSPADELKYHRDKTTRRLEHHLSSKDCEVMQFTGLHDKNGREIWEGDLLRREDDPVDASPEIVEYGTGGFAVTNDYLYELQLSSWEVTGNVHENPDLLK